MQTKLAVGLLVGLCGCGSSHTPTATVSGKVTMSAKAVPAGTVWIVPSSGTSFQGEIRPDGSYTVENVPFGQARIAVVGRVVPDPPPSGAPPAGRFLPPGIESQTAPGASSYAVAFPQKYADVSTSGLHLAVEQPVVSFDVDLKP